MDDQVRERVVNAARTHPAEAREAAHAIADPFLRCQALAWVARYCERGIDAVRIATEAAEAAAGAADAWAAAAGVAWPVRALVERGQARDAEPLMARAVAAAGKVPSPVRRVDALFLVVQGGWEAGGAAFRAAVGALLAAARAGPSDKTQGVVRDLVLMMAGAGRDHAEVLASMPEGQQRRQAVRALEARQHRSPRPFFW